MQPARATQDAAKPNPESGRGEMDLLQETSHDIARDPFLPLLLTLAALVICGGFQGLQLWSERANLKSLEERQAAQVRQAQQARSAVDAFAADTARLAAAGNANAQLLVEELKKRGVTINPDKQLPPPAADKR